MIIVGTSLRLSGAIHKDGAPCDLTGASAVVLRVRRPSGTETDYPAEIDEAATGAVHIDLAAAAVDEAGTWTAWAECVLAGGAALNTPASTFRVHARGSIG